MSGPWEKYKKEDSELEGPWSKYAVDTVDTVDDTIDDMPPDEPIIPKEPAWYDVPGKLNKTADETLGKIKREAQLTEQGKQHPASGGAWAALHMLSYPVKQVGNILSPIVSNPISKAIFEGAAYAGRENITNANKASKSINKFPVSKDKPLISQEKIESAQNYLKENPEVGNRIGSAFDVATSLPLGLGGKAVTQKAAIAAKKGIANAAENFAIRSGNRQVKINSPEWNMGARPEKRAEYGVLGNKAEQEAAQWESIKQPIFEALNKKIAGQLDNPENITSLEEIRKNAKAVIQKSNADKDWKRIQSEAIDKKIDDLYTTYENGNIDILEAQKLKIRTGRDGSWYTNGKGAMNDPDAPLKAQVANALYDALKNNVENKGSAGIKELNKALSDIIPMQLAAEKRMMVDKRNNFTSLDDVVGTVTGLAAAGSGNFAPLLFAGGNAAIKSPLAGKMAYKLSQNLKGQKIPPGIKAIQDAIAMPEKGPTINVKANIPITDPSRLLPPLKLGDMPPVSDMEIPIGAKLRKQGVVLNSDIERPALPSPEDIAKLYKDTPLLRRDQLFLSKDKPAPAEIPAERNVSYGTQIPESYFAEDPFRASLLNKKELKEMNRIEDANTKMRGASEDYPNMENYNPEELMSLDDARAYQYAKEIEQHQKDLARQARKAERESLSKVGKGDGTDAGLTAAAADNGVEMKMWAEQLGYGWPINPKDYKEFLRRVNTLKKYKK